MSQALSIDPAQVNPTTIGRDTSRAAAAGNYVTQMLALFEEFGEHEAIVRGERRITYTRLRAMVLEFAASLRDHGVRPGAAVALLVANLPESIALQFALHLHGCRTVWIPDYAPLREQIQFVELADVDVFVFDPDKAGGRVVEQVTGRERPLLALCTGPGGPAPDLTAPRAEGSLPFVPDEQAPAPQSLFYTGGTTGTPKLVHHEHRFFLALLAAAAYFRSIGEPGMRHLSTTGFVHVAGQMPVMLALCEDGTVFLSESVKFDDFLATIARERVTSVFISPARLYELLDRPDLDSIDLSSLRYLNCGGGPIQPARAKQAIERLGPILRPVYGLSELPLVADWPFMTVDPEHPERFGSCGRPFADGRLAIRDEQGRDLPAGEVGEVCASGALVMSGYWGQPELTARVLRDGWLHTGDVGYLDADGYLYLLDRTDDMIVTGIGAANVYTRPIEEVLTGHAAVSAAAVISVPDPRINNAVYAFVVGDPQRVTAEELRELVRTELSAFHRPAGIEFVDALPRTPMDKVDKKALRAGYLRRQGLETEGGR
jgi:fatty-acyl-CoA synthase